MEQSPGSAEEEVHTRRKHGRKKTSIHDVARQAETSISTVTRVIHNYPGVNPELRARIERAIHELQYLPPPAIRRQQHAGARLFNFLLTNRSLHLPFHSRVLQSIENECSRRGDLVLFRTLQYTPETSVEDLQLSRILVDKNRARPDGVILTGPSYPNLCEALERLGVPYIVLANNYTGPDLAGDAVAFDGQQGAYDATRYLLALGHRQVLFIADTTLSWYSGIYRGYVQAIEEAGLKPLGQIKTLSDSFYSNGYSSVEMAFEHSTAITAVFAGYDEIALGAWKALNDKSLSVPRDVSLIGFDDEDYAAFTVPPLSTVRIDIEAVGRELIGRLYNKLEQASVRLPIVKLGTALVKRGTCRPPKEQLAIAL